MPLERIKRIRSVPPESGFTLLEMMVVVAITGILIALSGWGFFTLKNKVSQRNLVSDISSALASGKMRALSRQINVVFFFDTTDNGGYYELDDLSAAQNLNTSTALTVVAGSFAPQSPNYGLPTGYSTRIVASNVASGSPFIASATSWVDATMASIPFPYPYSGISVDTRTGCTFCTAGKGALAFRPDGNVAFGTAAVAVGGALVLGQAGQTSGSQSSRRAIFVTLNGHVGSATQ